jgi:hypothetical protein
MCMSPLALFSFFRIYPFFHPFGLVAGFAVVDLLCAIKNRGHEIIRNSHYEV